VALCPTYVPCGIHLDWNRGSTVTAWWLDAISNVRLVECTSSEVCHYILKIPKLTEKVFWTWKFFVWNIFRSCEFWRVSFEFRAPMKVNVAKIARPTGKFVRLNNYENRRSCSQVFLWVQKDGRTERQRPSDFTYSLHECEDAEKWETRTWIPTCILLFNNPELATHSVTSFCYHAYQTLFDDVICHGVYEPRNRVLTSFLIRRMSTLFLLLGIS
jgi:hypothetical protein